LDVAGAGNVAMGAGLRSTTKGVEKPPDPKVRAPVLDPTLGGWGAAMPPGYPTRRAFRIFHAYWGFLAGEGAHAVTAKRVKPTVIPPQPKPNAALRLRSEPALGLSKGQVRSGHRPVSFTRPHRSRREKQGSLP